MARLYLKAAKDALYTYLNSNLNTYLAAVRTAWSSASVPVNCTALYKRDNKNPVYPKVIIHNDTTERRYANEDAPLIEPWLIYNFALEITHKSLSLQELDETLMGYEEAIERMQEADDTLGSNFVWVQMGNTDWMPVFENQKAKTFRQTIVVPLMCRTI